MTPAVARSDPDVQNLDLRIERHMGCMAGFLHLFDRHHQALGGKRHFTAPKRRPSSSPVIASASPSERSDASFSSSTFKPCPSSPEREDVDDHARPSLPLPVFDFKEGMRSSWKLRESPRLSLDSRAVVDAKGKLRPREIRTTYLNRSDEPADVQRRSPSVVARLMGLDALPDTGGGGETPSRAELRRSASESRVSRDLSHFRFVDPSSFQKYPPPPELKPELRGRNSKTSPLPPRAPAGGSYLQRRSFFDAQEFYPVPKRTGSLCLYGEIERRLRMRGIDEPAKDLETLKQILDALQLKGLLHLNTLRRNDGGGPPIVVMKPATKPPRQPARAPPSPPGRRNQSQPGTVRRDGRSRASPDRSPCSPARRRQLNEMESPKFAPPTPPARRRESPIHPPHCSRTSPRKLAPDSLAAESLRNRRSVSPIIPAPVEDDASTTVSESSVSNSLGRSLLERCDKLLYSIAAITSSVSANAATDQQPSPVSVLDSSAFLGGDGSPPSPIITKRSIDYRDRFAEWEEDQLTPTCRNGRVEDEDFVYVSEIMRALRDPLKDPTDVYMTLEKRRREDRSEPSRAHRRMLFDVVAEILDRKRNEAPWEAFPCGGGLMREVWAEVRRTRERVATAGDCYLNDVTREAIRKDMAAAADRGWEGACPSEMSDAVLNVERQIFKDLLAEAIQDLADVATATAGGGTCQAHLPRRKLVF